MTSVSGFDGSTVTYPDGASDHAFVSRGSSPAAATDGADSWNGWSVLYRRTTGNFTDFQFATDATSLDLQDSDGRRGFDATAPISLHLKGTRGRVISPGTSVTFHHPGITGIALDRSPVVPDSNGPGFVEINVPAGTHELDLEIADTLDARPTAAFSFTQPGALQASFDATASTDADSAIDSYLWDFGDGQTGTGATPAHTYARGGNYWVSLTVTDADGETDRHVRRLSTLSPPAIPPVTPPAPALPGQTIRFDAYDAHDPEEDIASYHWDFGGGQTATGIVTTRSWSESGYHPVTLTVTDSGGRSTSTTFQVGIRSLLPYVTASEVFAPIADGHVQGGSNSGTNFGSLTTMTVKDDGGESVDRRAYLKFDVSSLNPSALVGAARLQLTVANLSNFTPTRPVHIHRTQSESWGETTLTWNNAPGYGPSLGSAVITGLGQVVDLPISPPFDPNNGLLGYIVRTPGENIAGIALGTREGSAGAAPSLSVDVLNPVDYTTWQGGIDWQGTPAALQLPDADADLDGSENLLEFAFNTDPLAPGALPPMVLEPGTTSASVSFFQPRDTLTYQIEWFTTLGSWHATGVTQGDPDPVTRMTPVLISLPAAPESVFFRLRISEPDAN